MQKRKENLFSFFESFQDERERERAREQGITDQ
jgi:hypothetical protein